MTGQASRARVNFSQPREGGGIGGGASDHPRVYRSRSAAAATHTLSVSPSRTHSLASPQEWASEGLHTAIEPGATSPLPPTTTHARHPWGRTVTGSLAESLTLLTRAQTPLSPPSPIVVDQRTPATYSPRIRNGGGRGCGCGGSGGGGGAGGVSGSSGWGGAGCTLFLKVPVLGKETCSLFSRSNELHDRGGSWGV